MKCPVCGYEDSRVIDSRPVEESNSIKRRRECLSCKARFTTYEVIDQQNPFVIKKSGARELFDRNKLLAGLYKACEKRPVNPEEIADEIEAQIQGSMKSEVTSTRIGEMVMELLKEKDPVAYVWFASVHREFKDIDTFMREINELKQEGR